jgi:plasmid stabilization system protein ParE
MEDAIMPRGSKAAYTDKQKRQAEHIEEGYKKEGLSAKEAAQRAWATVNKETGGGKKSGSGRKNHSASSSKTTSKAKQSSSSEKRSAAAKKGWVTRRKAAKKK